MSGGQPASSASSASSDGPEPAGAAPHPFAVQLGAVVTVAFTLLDQATKQIASSQLERGRFVPWLHEQVGWQLIYNPGGAFGVPAPSWIFLLVTVIVVVLVARTLPRTHSLTAASAYGLLLAGALGNVLDRLFREGDPGLGGGFVVDFVAWGAFPRFNVADSAITVGFVLLVLALILEERRGARAERQADPGDADAGDHGPSSGPTSAEGDPAPRADG